MAIRFLTRKTRRETARHAANMVEVASRMGIRAGAVGLACVLVLCLFGGLPPAFAATEVVAVPESTPGPPGLPDGRVYEQVSPTSKNGNFFDAPSEITFGLASASGEAIVYPMSGPVGEASSGLITEYVSRRKPGKAWPTVAATSRPVGGGEATVVNGPPLTMVPSSSFGAVLFTSIAPYVSEDPGGGVNIFVSRNPFVEPEWLGRPQAEFVTPALGAVDSQDYVVVGASPDLHTAYYAYAGTLTPQDATRTPYVENGSTRRDAPWGFYEWHEGSLVSAGELPGGTFDPFGAVPAAVGGDTDFYRRFPGKEAKDYDNEVSEDGSIAFFVSPDPAASSVTDPTACGADPPCSAAAPQLYVRKPGSDGGKVSVLVSASQLAGHEGEPAKDGVAIVPEAAGAEREGTTAFASPDGSHVFFASEDRLTALAPANGAVKTYEYDVATGVLTYLPGVTGPIAKVSDDGSEALFVGTGTIPSPIDLWQAGAEGGTVSQIARPLSGTPTIDGARTSADGQTVIFRTAAELEGGFNDGGDYYQVYSYNVGGSELNCVSCPPHGLAPRGDADITHNDNGGSNARPQSPLEPRAISSDGHRVFFDTPAALVPADTNGVRDVYEWEDGTVYLISSGTGSEDSLYLDSDETGENVFFATAEGLVNGDVDAAYDVYDARIPRPGDNPPPSQVPCKGSVCQGPPSVPRLLSPPGSETFSGAGNLTPKRAAHKRSSKRPACRHKSKRLPKRCARKGAKRERRVKRACGHNARARHKAKAARRSQRGHARCRRRRDRQARRPKNVDRRSSHDRRRK